MKSYSYLLLAVASGVTGALSNPTVGSPSTTEVSPSYSTFKTVAIPDTTIDVPTGFNTTPWFVMPDIFFGTPRENLSWTPIETGTAKSSTLEKRWPIISDGCIECVSNCVSAPPEWNWAFGIQVPAYRATAFGACIAGCFVPGYPCGNSVSGYDNLGTWRTMSEGAWLAWIYDRLGWIGVAH